MMKRGDIYYADLNPTVGTEINKKRPVLIVSNDANNRASPTITILPVTSNVSKVYPFEVALSAQGTGLLKTSKIQCQQIRTISKLRITSPAIGKVDEKILKYCEEALKLHLGFA
jgi:mRNA interferase MazF